MLNKLHQKHGNNKNYLKPKSDMNTSFGLNHFAGVVFYDTRAFLEKNRDTFRFVVCFRTIQECYLLIYYSKYVS